MCFENKKVNGQFRQLVIKHLHVLLVYGLIMVAVGIMAENVTNARPSYTNVRTLTLANIICEMKGII